jgi:hypothetical protein
MMKMANNVRITVLIARHQCTQSSRIREGPVFILTSGLKLHDRNVPSVLRDRNVRLLDTSPIIDDHTVNFDPCVSE